MDPCETCLHHSHLRLQVNLCFLILACLEESALRIKRKMAHTIPCFSEFHEVIELFTLPCRRAHTPFKPQLPFFLSKLLFVCSLSDEGEIAKFPSSILPRTLDQNMDLSMRESTVCISTSVCIVLVWWFERKCRLADFFLRFLVKAIESAMVFRLNCIVLYFFSDA